MDSIITYIIIGITAFVSYQAFQNRSIMDRFIFSPYLAKREGQWYRAITSGFLHADMTHLVVNMLVLYFFGRNVEIAFGHYLGQFGPIAYLILYVLGLLISDAYILSSHLMQCFLA